MPYSEADLLPLSALQHLLYCERQCALIHIERVWVENRYTAEGQRLHKHAHEAGASSRGQQRTTRGLEVRSFSLGMFGRCDLVRLTAPDGRTESVTTAWRKADLPSRQDWTVTPVEYKRGRPKKNACDRVQLCGQAICLEEMLGVAIPSGQIFYGQTRQCVDVPFDDALRDQTAAAAARLHELFRGGVTPPAVYSKGKCGRCSLFEQCLPTLRHRGNVAGWFERQLAATGGTTDE